MCKAITSKIKPEQQAHIHTLMAFKFKVRVLVRIAREVRTVDLLPAIAVMDD